MPLEFSESMHIEMEGFVGKRQIFGHAADVVDSNRLSQSAPRQFGPSSSAICSLMAVGAGNPQQAPPRCLGLQEQRRWGTTHHGQQAANTKPPDPRIW